MIVSLKRSRFCTNQTKQLSGNMVFWYQIKCSPQVFSNSLLIKVTKQQITIFSWYTWRLTHKLANEQMERPCGILKLRYKEHSNALNMGSCDSTITCCYPITYSSKRFASWLRFIGFRRIIFGEGGCNLGVFEQSVSCWTAGYKLLERFIEKKF